MTDYSKRYTPEFKQKAVELYNSTEDATYAQIGRELGVDAGSIADWVKRANGGQPAADPGANPFQMAEDLKRLQRENARLKRENEILLKASAFFASKQL
jgi:transposase